MSIIVTAGWSIYPLGDFCGYLSGAVDETLLIVVYNVAGFRWWGLLDSGEPLEDLAPCWLPRDLGCSRALHVHARVLGAGYLH